LGELLFQNKIDKKFAQHILRQNIYTFRFKENFVVNIF